MRRLILLLALCATPALAQTSLRDAEQEAKLLPADGEETGYFGDAVSLSGDRALVGAIGADGGRGAAYIFVRSGGAWTFEARLAPSENGTSFFGDAVALSGDRALVGSPLDDDRRGAVYVFVRDGSSWTQEARLNAADGAADDYFGASVSLDGDRALVGSVLSDGDVPDVGAAYVFVRDGTGWAQEARLTADDGAEGDYVGGSVSLSGDRALVGADRLTDEGGAAYVFVRQGAAWTQEARLEPDETSGGFGWSVDLSGDHAVVGAPGDDRAGTFSGAAFVFARTGSTWTQDARLSADDGEPSDGFGWSVALTDGVALVGSPGDDDNGGVSGSVYVLAQDGEAWPQRAKLTADDGASPDNFGWAVSLSGDRALFGALQDEDNGANSGSAYIFSGITATAGAAIADAVGALSAAVPNPTASRATLTLTLAAPQAVRATLVDALGREVAVLLDAAVAGETRLDVDTSALPPGVYVVRVDGESFAETRRLTVVR